MNRQEGIRQNNMKKGFCWGRIPVAAPKKHVPADSYLKKIDITPWILHAITFSEVRGQISANVH